jgi:hypothetical protein
MPRPRPVSRATGAGCYLAGGDRTSDVVKDDVRGPAPIYTNCTTTQRNQFQKPYERWSTPLQKSHNLWSHNIKLPHPKHLHESLTINAQKVHHLYRQQPRRN